MFITTRDANSLCRFCRQGSAHTLRIHAKVLLALDEVIEDDTAPVVIPQPAPHRAPPAPAVQLRQTVSVY